MDDNNNCNDNKNTIHKSFKSLVEIIEKQDNNNNNKIQNEVKLFEDKFNKDYFCCKECYDKFIKVVKKIKDNKIDLTKIDWGKYSDSSNIIVKLVTYYYNLGLQNSNK